MNIAKLSYKSKMYCSTQEKLKWTPSGKKLWISIMWIGPPAAIGRGGHIMQEDNKLL